MSYCIKTNTIELSVLTLRWGPSFLVSNVDTQSILPFFICGIIELDRSIGLRRIGLQGLILNLEILKLHMSHFLTGKKIIYPPLHLKLGLMKQFVKALSTDGDCLNYIILTFPGLSIEKIKVGVFNGSQIWQLIKDEQFTSTMSDSEKNAWLSFRDVVENFLGNIRTFNYAENVQKLLESYKALGCNMSIKLYFLHWYLAKFLENLGAASDEQGKRFHQDLKVMEERYQGRWDAHMMADYVWSIKRDSPHIEHSRKTDTRKFLP